MGRSAIIAYGKLQYRCLLPVYFKSFNYRSTLRAAARQHRRTDSIILLEFFDDHTISETQENNVNKSRIILNPSKVRSAATAGRQAELTSNIV